MYTIPKVKPVFSALDFEQCPWYCVPAFPAFPPIVSRLTEVEEESMRVVPVLCWSQHISFPHKTAYCVLCDQTKYPRNSQSVHKHVRYWHSIPNLFFQIQQIWGKFSQTWWNQGQTLRYSRIWEFYGKTHKEKIIEVYVYTCTSMYLKPLML